MTTSFVSFHIAPHAEGLSAAFVGTLEWLLPRMRMAVNAKTRRPGESLVARGAAVSVLGLASKVRRGRLRNIMVMLMLELIWIAWIYGICLLGISDRRIDSI